MNDATAARSRRSSTGVSKPDASISRSRRTRSGTELEDDDVGRLYEQLEKLGIDLRDDCGRDADLAPVDDAALASATTDTLQLSSTRSAATGGSTPDEEIELARRIERGDLSAKERHDQRQPAAGLSRSPEVPRVRADAARLIQEGILA